MRRELFKHKIAYIALALGLALFTVLFLGSWPNKMAQRFVIAALSSYYFAWGIVTHIKSKSLTTKVALEYVAIALFGGCILGALTL